MTDAAQTPPPEPDGVTGLTPGRPTSAARSRLSRIMTVLDTNLLGTVHGGVVMKLVDDVAGVVAQRHSGGAAVTASMDEMDFVAPVRVGDLVHAEAQVNWAGTSSMEVGVRVLAEPWNKAGVEPIRVATAYLVFVAVDEDGRPRRVPPVLPETDEDRRRFGEAEIRRMHRLARREAIQRSRAEGLASTPSAGTTTHGTLDAGDA
jgi:acyl-CoA hydrolase